MIARKIVRKKGGKSFKCCCALSDGDQKSDNDPGRQARVIQAGRHRAKVVGGIKGPGVGRSIAGAEQGQELGGIRPNHLSEKPHLGKLTRTISLEKSLHQFRKIFFREVRDSRGICLLPPNPNTYWTSIVPSGQAKLRLGQFTRV